MIPWLRGDEPFPPVSKALKSPNGLLCAGGDLSPRRLLEAYAHGIFPWFSEGDLDREGRRGALGGWRRAGLPWMQG